MLYAEAKKIADEVSHYLSPYCERISIAGSVRRQKSECGDIEVVVIPKRVPIINMFGDKVGTQPMPEFCQTINLWQKVKGEPTGKYTQRLLPEGIKLDIFIATEDNWGHLLVIRTGSADFSKKVASRWVKFGYHSVEGMLHDGRKPIILREEQDLFNKLGMPWIEPTDRI